MIYFIIKSNILGEKRWEGKGFSSLPCKIYSSFNDAANALDAYWYSDDHDQRDIIIRPIKEGQIERLIKRGIARW